MAKTLIAGNKVLFLSVKKDTVMGRKILRLTNLVHVIFEVRHVFVFVSWIHQVN